MSQEWERERWWIKKPASFRSFGKPWMSKGLTMWQIPKRAVWSWQLKAPAISLVPGGDISWQWGFSCLPIQPVGRGDLFWGWCRRMLPSSIKSNNLFLGTGCGYFYVWCSLGEELFFNIQTEPLAYKPWQWPLAEWLAASPFTSKKSLTASTAAHVVTENCSSPSCSPASFHLLGLVAPGLHTGPYQGLHIPLEQGNVSGKIIQMWHQKWWTSMYINFSPGQ